MDAEYTFDRIVQLSKQLSDERVEASRWRGIATGLADATLHYLRTTNPAANIPEWLYKHHADLYDALQRHSMNLYENTDYWQKELGLDDI